MITAAIVGTFLVGYAFIAFESAVKINKSAIALFMCVLCWSLYMFGAHDYLLLMHGDELASAIAGAHDGSVSSAISNLVGNGILIPHLGSTAETIFFLLGAMTIVEVVDYNGGFNFVRERLTTRSKKKLLWEMVIITFFLSAVLDNLTTSLVMIAVLRKLIHEHKDRLVYAAMVIVAANAGGAFSPIGDVTTIMLWINGSISSLGVIKELLLPSIVSALLPTLLLSFTLKGKFEDVKSDEGATSMSYAFSKAQRNAIFLIGVLGLISVPVFRAITGLPPFMGILLVLSVMWVVVEIFCAGIPGAPSTMKRVEELLHRVDFTTLLFFLGILMTVASLEETGVLHSFGEWLEAASGGNPFIVTGIIGLASSIVDNVPLVASCMGMYEIASSSAGPEMAQFMLDGPFWQLLAFCAGTGGSILIIGSAAGVAVMGLEKISFGWYLKNISWLALIGYFAGMIVYWLQLQLLF